MVLPTYGQPIVRSDPQTFPDNIKLFFGDDNDASIYYDGSDLIINPKEFGSGILQVLGDVAFGDGSVASAGTIRLPNASNIVFRNAANDGDVEAIQVDGSDNVIVGNTANGDTLYRTQAGSVHDFDQAISVGGGDVAAAGTIRLPNASNIVFRNTANDGNVEAVQVDGSDNVIIGNIANGNTLYRTEPGFVHSFDQAISIVTGSLDLNSQGSIINVGAAGNQWAVNFLIQDASNSGGTILHRLNNSSDTAASAAIFHAQVAGSSSGDPQLRLQEVAGHILSIGIDVSSSIAALGMSDTLGTNDALRITDATPPVITYNTTHPTGTFDYICESCGRHEAEIFRCCGPVAWHDDNADFRDLVLAKPGSLEYMEKIGVMERTFNNEGKPEVFTKLGPDWMFVGGMAYQNRQRIDRHYEEIDRRLKAVGG